MTEPHLGGSYDQLLRAAQMTHDAGFVSFARSDHYLAGADSSTDSTDAFATLAGLARDTKEIRLCVLVSPITFRHPAVIAKSAASIDQMSDGRFDLGVGTGWMDAEHQALGIPFPDWPERWERLSETLEYLQAAFSSGRNAYRGAHYQIDADVNPTPTGIRLVIGGSGTKRTPTLAGKWADEYNSFITRPASAAGRIETMRAAAAGRRVEVTMMGRLHLARDETAYRSLLAKSAKKRGVSQEDWERKLADSGQIYGTPGRARESIAALEEVGVDRIYVQWLDLNDLDSLSRLLDAIHAV